MGKANYLKTAGGLSVSGGGVREVWAVGTSKFDRGVELIRNGDLEGLYDLLFEGHKKIKHYIKQGFRVEDGVVYVGNDALPTTLGEYLVRMADENLPCEPILKFWENVNLNPSRQSALELFDFLTLYQHPLTEDGCFIGYRRVREDFTDFHTRKMDNSVGQIVSMPRDEVNDDRTEGCSTGLHVANWKYASEFYSGGAGNLIEVKVNPKDVVSVPLECNQQKIRVCKFEVLATCEFERKDILTDERGTTYSSTANEDFDEDDCVCDDCDDDYCCVYASGDNCDDDDDDDYDDDDYIAPMSFYEDDDDYDDDEDDYDDDNYNQFKLAAQNPLSLNSPTNHVSVYIENANFNYSPIDTTQIQES